MASVAASMTRGSRSTARRRSPGNRRPAARGEALEAGPARRFYLSLDEGEEMAYCCLERHRGEKVTAFHLHREDTGAFVLA